MRVQRVALIEATRQRPADVDNVGPGEDRTVPVRGHSYPASHMRGHLLGGGARRGRVDCGQRLGVADVGVR
jgi:hypothetical protein